MSTVQARRGRASAATEPPGLLVAPVGVSRGRAPGWWGMVLVIFTEATFFTILLTSYWYYRFQNGPAWPPGGIDKPKLLLVSIMTPILLLSSGPIHWAERGIKQGQLWRLKLGLLATFVMGATFLVLQGVEYHTILTEEFTPKTNVYGTIFFAITGFHGFHVLVGLLMILWLQYYTWRGAFTSDRYLPVELITMYWHFVDAVWVFILGTIYLSPHIWP